MITPSRAVLLAGPLGSGKTAVAIQVGELLEEAGVAHAVIDLDWLCWAGPGITGDRLASLMCRNLAALTAVYASEGVGTLVLARAVSGAGEVTAVRAAVGGLLVALRLSVPPDVAAARLAERGGDDAGEADELAHASSRLLLPAVRNHGRPARETALEVLDRLGWLR